MFLKNGPFYPRAILGVIILSALAGCYDPADACKNERTAKNSALIASKELVKRKLSNPNSARFPMLSDQGVKVEFLKECQFQVIAFVDAQNAFGGTVRTRYAIDIEADPVDGGHWGRNLVWLH